MSTAQPHRRDFLQQSTGAFLGMGMVGAAGAVSLPSADFPPSSRSLPEQEQLVQQIHRTIQAARRVLDRHGVGCEREACCDVCWAAGRLLSDLSDHERVITAHRDDILPAG